MIASFPWYFVNGSTNALQDSRFFIRAFEEDERTDAYNIDQCAASFPLPTGEGQGEGV
jgi:hypothetical protein